MVMPGLEAVAEEEVKQELGAEVKRSGHGIVVFRVEEITPELLHLRTTEDVYLLGWGTDQLTYRAEDLEKIRRWTSREVDWDRFLRLHHSLRPKRAGKPTYRLVTQMTGEHGYRRVDARKALARGLEGKLPAGWKHAEENATVEVWLTIHGATAVCGLRRSGRRWPPPWFGWPASARTRSIAIRCAAPARSSASSWRCSAARSGAP
jgi:tRNA (guanine6-N2)-methyltransferase